MALEEMGMQLVANYTFLHLALAQILVTGSRALLLKQWKWQENECVRTWRAVHVAPVASMAFDSTSTLLATGTAPFWCHAMGVTPSGLSCD